METNRLEALLQQYPKFECNDDKATLAKINTQLMREEPVIVLMPPSLNFTLDSATCGCREESGILIDCRANTTLTGLTMTQARA